MDIRTITVAILDIYKLMHPLMWVFFGLKCVKVTSFSILQTSASTDATALKVSILHPMWNVSQ